MRVRWVDGLAYPSSWGASYLLLWSKLYGFFRSVSWRGAISSFRTFSFYATPRSRYPLCPFSDKHLPAGKPALLKKISARCAHYAQFGFGRDAETGTPGYRRVP